MKLKELITDRKTGALSASKVWFNLGNIAMTWAFVWDAHIGNLTDMKLLAYGAVVAGSGIASKWLSKKYDAKLTDDAPKD